MCIVWEVHVWASLFSLKASLNGACSNCYGSHFKMNAAQWCHRLSLWAVSSGSLTNWGHLWVVQVCQWKLVFSNSFVFSVELWERLETVIWVFLFLFWGCLASLSGFFVESKCVFQFTSPFLREIRWPTSAFMLHRGRPPNFQKC